MPYQQSVCADSLYRVAEMHERRINTQKRRINTQKRRINTQQRRINTQKRRINTQKRRVNTQRDVLTHKRDVLIHKRDLSTHKRDISTNKRAYPSTSSGDALSCRSLFANRMPCVVGLPCVVASEDALRSRVLSSKEPLIIGLICGKL